MSHYLQLPVIWEDDENELVEAIATLAVESELKLILPRAALRENKVYYRTEACTAVTTHIFEQLNQARRK